MKAGDLRKILIATLVVLTAGPCVAFCMVNIDSINIEPDTSSPSGIISIDSISYYEHETTKGEIRIAASDELVNLEPQAPMANEAAREADLPDVQGSDDMALRTGLPGQARSTAILGAPTYTPSLNKLGGTVRPISIEHVNIIHRTMVSTMPGMQSAGIGTTVMSCGPPQDKLVSPAFNRNFLTKTSNHAQVPLGVLYQKGVFMYRYDINICNLYANPLWRAIS